jgi:hypothetical protein
MGFFRKLFGGDEPPAAAPPAPRPAPESPATPAAVASPGGPYRGADYVEVGPAPDPRPPVKIKPIWDSWSEVLAAELGEVLPVRSMVYVGESGSELQAVRRVVFVDGGVVVDWEEKLASRGFLSDRLTSRVDDRIIIPRATGVVARHVVTGEPCWELPHPAALHARPVRYPGGELLLVFADQSWMRVSPRDGACLAEGAVRSEREARELADQGRPLVAALQDHVTYGGRRVALSSDGLDIEHARHAEADPADPPAEPPGPTPGTDPIDEWQPARHLGLVGGRLAALLTREWGGQTRVAVGLFEPTSLEPLRLLELGDAGRHGSKDCHVVDDLLTVKLQLADPTQRNPSPFGYYAMFLVDAYAERVLACFAEDRPSLLFDPAGRQVWRSEL